MPDSITPSQDLRDKWLNEAPNTCVYDYLIDRAAQWGADQELEACVQRQALLYGNRTADELRAARRPKPPSLKEQALQKLTSLEALAQACGHDPDDIIRRALESIEE